MDPAVRHLAEQQHGLITTAQITVAGSSLKTVARWVAESEIIRLTRSLYVLADQRPEVAAERHLQLARGA